jgi:hypothetical protein
LRPIAYETWSPTNAPSAATAITAARFGSPPAANTPAVITIVSDGTTGKKPSMTAIANNARYTHGEVIADSSSSIMNPTLRSRAAGRQEPIARHRP